MSGLSDGGRDGERSEREGGAFHVKPHWRCRGLRPTGSCAARPQEARSDIWRVRRGSILAQQRIKRFAASADVRFSNVEADAGKAVREQPRPPTDHPSVPLRFSSSILLWSVERFT